MALCEKGLDGPALAEFFEETCGAAVKETMTGVVEGALEGCALTAAFPSAKEAYNAIAGKVPGLDEIELDLPTYLLDNFVEGCKKLPASLAMVSTSQPRSPGRRRCRPKTPRAAVR